MQLMGGDICVQSTPGLGSCFWFELPGMASPCAPAAAPGSEECARLELDVLVVEDSPVNQLVVSLMLQKLVCRVRLAGNGLEATRRLRDMGYEVPIVALTANAMMEDRARCLAQGMNDFLAKPISLARLRSCLLRHCR